MNSTVVLIYMTSLLILIGLSYLRIILDGPYIYHVHQLVHALQRSLLVLNGGYFIEANI